MMGNCDQSDDGHFIDDHFINGHFADGQYGDELSDAASDRTGQLRRFIIPTDRSVCIEAIVTSCQRNADK